MRHPAPWGRLLTGALLLIFFSVPGTAAERTLHHALTVTLVPATHHLGVSDTVSAPAGEIISDFYLNAAVRLTSSEPAVREIGLGAVDQVFGPGTAARTPLKRYQLTTPATSVTVQYDGTFDYPLSDPKEEYTRGFRDTIGTLGPEGIYLAASSFWHPRVANELVTFTLDATVPAGWHLISQGNGTSRDTTGHARWDAAGVMDEIYLVGGPLEVYRDAAGTVETLAYLRTPEPALAAKYLLATAQYLEMYRSLIGPYPYKKFALVENFWETGYGMPTFTLLGSQIIRFPFILSSSYPHEILHNWWGNSVFVDYESGNWCEGLTAYMADHLIQEQRGTGDEYRRATLQKYRDYVRSGRDFPLSEFRNRFSAATEAVGYGKSLMGFHTVRRSIGDDAFRKTVARFAREFTGKRASFRDFQRIAEQVSHQSLAWVFDDLITRPGAASLSVSGVQVRATATGFSVSGTLAQTQAGAPFALDVPIVIRTASGLVTSSVRLTQARVAFDITVAAQPLVLAVDPAFDVFRRLDPRETPPSIGQVFGEPQALAVLPASMPAAEQDAWKTLFAGWTSDSHRVEVTTDAAVTTLPADRPVWVVGTANRFASAIMQAAPGLRSDGTTLTVDGEPVPFAGHSTVVVTRHPANAEKVVGWLTATPLSALPGLGRKLPHYGKYSYLGFEGTEPVNTVKGQWRMSDSPLVVDVRSASSQRQALEPMAPAPRKALAELPPVFSRQALRDHVSFLASPALQGRGLGTPGSEQAAAYIAERFKAAGLKPGGDGGTYFQRFRVERAADGQAHDVANVIGLLPGSRAEWSNQSAWLTAHYDHLGLGWPDVHAGDEGTIHPGADDNASGVAVMLELAKTLAAGAAPHRTLIFAAFTGEESGRLGSQYAAAHPPLPLARTWGVINLDTVGRLGTQAITVLGTGTASEWPHIFRGAGFVTGVNHRLVAESLESSDQVSFIERGVPAVQLFTAAHADYHRPSDTPDKIDDAGLVQVATFVKEAIQYLGERPDPMTTTVASAGGTPPARPTTTPGTTAAPARRVSLGTVPDFTFAGPGVRVTGTVPNSPAAVAGVLEGDIITAVAGTPIVSLQEYAAVLRGLAPGQRVKIGLTRGTQTLTVNVVLAER